MMIQRYLLLIYVKSNNMRHNQENTNNALERYCLGACNFNVKEKRYIC